MYYFAAADPGTAPPEGGDGVLARLIVDAVGKGLTQVTLEDAKLVDASNNVYPIDATGGGTVALGVPCP